MVNEKQLAPYTLLAMLLLGVGACASPPTKGSLKGACQFRPCECRESNVFIGLAAERQPVIWSEDGTPTCPEGFELRNQSGWDR